MPSHKLLLAVSAGISTIAAAGCWGDSARAQKLEPKTTAAAGTHEGQPFTPRHEHARPPHKEVGRERFLSTYRDPVEGITFRYPRNYLLEEGEVQEHSYFLKTQEGLDADQPGAELVATVTIPEDGYPNTTFEHGSLQLVTQDTEEARCSLEAEGAVTARGRFTTGEGLMFDWVEQDNLVGGTEIRERHYAAKAGEQCYEFFATVAVDASSDPNGSTKPADVAKIQRQLEKIISTLQVVNVPRD
jgi:hypothetical protein